MTFRWGSEAWLVAAIALPFVLGVAIAALSARHRRRLRGVFGAGMLARVLPTGVRVRRTIRDLLLVVALTAAAFALAEPLFEEQTQKVKAAGVDLVLAVDLSRSMDCADVDPSRLERARREIIDLLDILEGDRVGLVVFAGSAFSRLPLTEDHEAVRLIASELDTGTFQAQGSALGAALRASMRLLDSPGDDAGQAILVLSDGEIHDPEDALAAAAEAAARGIRVFGLGIGTQPSPIPVGDGSMITERDGTVVLSAPSDQVLTDVARATGGAYVRSVASAEDVERMYREEMRGRMVAAVRGERTQRSSESGHGLPLAVATFALLAAAWLGEGRRALKFAAILLALAALAPSDALAATPAEADALYRSGRYADAAKAFEALVVEDPDDADLLGRLAAARYRAGDYRGAARAWVRQSELAGGRADAEYNAGNAEYRGGRLEDALRRYDRALELDPANPSAAQNKQLVERELKLREQMKPPAQKSEEQQGESAEPEDAPSGQGEKPENAGEQPGEKKPDKEGQSGQASDAPPPPGGKPEAADGEGKPGQKGPRGDETDDTQAPGEAEEIANLGEGGEPGEPTTEGGVGSVAEGKGDGDGQISAVQAEKILDSIEEGQPRIVVPGDPTRGKPW